MLVPDQYGSGRCVAALAAKRAKISVIADRSGRIRNHSPGAELLPISSYMNRQKNSLPSSSRPDTSKDILRLFLNRAIGCFPNRPRRQAPAAIATTQT
jgi:hypothetical protein